MKKSKRRLWIFLALLGLTLTFAVTVGIRRDIAARVELELVNEAPVPISYRYRGFYGSVEGVIASRGSSQVHFRDMDSLAVFTTVNGLQIVNQVPLVDQASTRPPRRMIGNVSLVRNVFDQTGKLREMQSILEVSPELTKGPDATNLALSLGIRPRLADQ